MSDQATKPDLRLATADEPERRRSRRIPVCSGCTVLAGSGRFRCAVLDFSLTGMSLSAAVFEYVRPGMTIAIESIDQDGQVHPIGLKCVVVQVREVKGAWIAGIDTVSRGSTNDWQRYYDRAYYPQVTAGSTRADLAA